MSDNFTARDTGGLTARDIEGQSFAKKFRGLDPEQVQLFLKSVAENYEQLVMQNGDLREEIGRLTTERDQYRDREETLQQTLVSAQKMANEFRHKAEGEAELLLKEARLKADRLLHTAQDQIARIDDEKQQARLERDAFERNLRSLIEQHLALLESRIEDRANESDNVTLFRSSRSTEAG